MPSKHERLVKPVADETLLRRVAARVSGVRLVSALVPVTGGFESVEDGGRGPLGGRGSGCGEGEGGEEGDEGGEGEHVGRLREW